MYIIYNSQQLDFPKEIAEAFNSYFSTLTADINTNSHALLRVTNQTLPSILFNTKVIEEALAVIKSSYGSGSDGVPLPYFVSADSIYQSVNFFHVN